jgi:hypothetical protein
MELSDLNKQIEELRPQIAAELDPALRREMEKTFKHYQRQLRKLTTHRKPWYGLKTLVVFLASVFLLMVYVCIRFEEAFGLRSTGSAAFLAAVGLVLITAMAFLVLRIISPDAYTQLVQTCFANLNRLNGGEDDSSTTNLPTWQAAERKPPQLPLSSAPPSASKVSFDNSSVPAINAGQDQLSAEDEKSHTSTDPSSFD